MIKAFNAFKFLKENKMKKMFKIGQLSLLSLSLLFLMGCEPPPKYSPVPKAKLSEKYDYCNKTVPYGYPQFKNIDKKRDDNMLFSCHDNYTLGYRTDYEIAYWTAEYLKGENIKNFKTYPMREDRMRADVNFDNDFSASYDFGLAQDKGYLFRPFVSTKNYLGNEKMMSKTYYWTNMFPYPRDAENWANYQNYLKKVIRAEEINKERAKKGEELIKIPEFKFKKDTTSILWDNVEQTIRDLIEKYDEGYVFSGSVFYENNGYGYIDRFGEVRKGYDFNDQYKAGKTNLAFSKEAVGLVAPSHIYKMIYFPKQDQTIVYIIPNSANKLKTTNPNDYRQSLETLEKITNLNFFPYKKK